MNYAKSTIDKRLKLIRKGLRESKKEWSKANTRSVWISRHAKYWGNEYDYSTVMSSEDQEKYDRAEHRAELAIKKQIKLDEEKKYLEGLVKGRMTKFDKYNWEYMK